MRAPSHREVPTAPRTRRPHTGLGRVVVGLGIALAGAALAGRAMRPRPETGVHQKSIRRTRDGAAILGASVLFDSALEHLRGGFENRAMYVAPTMAAVSVAASLAEPGSGGRERGARLAHIVSLATGVIGTGFHLYNITKRPGGISWNNLFYAAPIGAPGALAVAGALGMSTEVLAAQPRNGRRNGRALAGLTGAFLLGETAEVALLHFRGAFHNPAMYLPVTVPTAAGIALISLALHPDGRDDRVARALLGTVGALGLLGTAFHIYGVGRNMGGWSNWRQNALVGPPTPAPISFTGLGLAGLAAVDLLQGTEDRR
ncbi:hypothetical protein [Palleronia rufa]|uniref:hypothetical protein n=1 Tax=Palleronia rufa TaxID=1530186 RepID=UPI00068FD3CA|nr:hypothetical protein [Palleronia rufa]